MMDAPAINLGSPVRAVLGVSLQILSPGDGDNLFSGGNQIDWSAYDYTWSNKLLVKPTDTIAVPLAADTVELLFIKTSAPIEVDFTQDSVARVLYVKPLVQPANWFATARSPSEVPKAFLPGSLSLIGGSISAITIKGLAGTAQSANVTIAVAGYHT